MNICLVSANDVMEHFAFPGNIEFAADYQGSFSCIIHEGCCGYLSSVKQCLPSVNHEQFPMQMIHKQNKWLQILAEGDFPPKLLWSENADLKFSVNNEGEDVNKKPRSRENNKTTRARRTEEQGIGISEALWSRYGYITFKQC